MPVVNAKAKEEKEEGKVKGQAFAKAAPCVHLCDAG